MSLQMSITVVEKICTRVEHHSNRSLFAAAERDLTTLPIIVVGMLSRT